MNKDSTIFYIARHGQVDWNTKGLVLGQRDHPLNDKGIKQAKRLAKEIKNIKFDAIFSSDLLRAKETAEIIASGRKIPVQTNKTLREQTFGHFEGWKKNEFINLFDKWNEMSDEERHNYTLSDDMESNANAVKRLINFLEETSKQYLGKTVLVIAHGALMRYLLIQLGYASYDYLSHFENTGYIKITIKEEDIVLNEVKGFKREEKK